MATHELTFKAYQKKLKDTIRTIQENFLDMLKTNSEHVDFEAQVKSADIVKGYKTLIHLISEIRTYIIVNHQFPPQETDNVIENKLVRLRDDIAVFLYELEIPLL